MHGRCLLDKKLFMDKKIAISKIYNIATCMDPCTHCQIGIKSIINYSHHQGHRGTRKWLLGSQKEVAAVGEAVLVDLCAERGAETEAWPQYWGGSCHLVHSDSNLLSEVSVLPCLVVV